MELDKRILVSCPCSFRFFLEADTTRAQCPHCDAPLQLVDDERVALPGIAAGGSMVEAFECPACHGALFVGPHVEQMTCEQCGHELEFLPPESAFAADVAGPAQEQTSRPREPTDAAPPDEDSVPELEAWADHHRAQPVTTTTYGPSTAPAAIETVERRATPAGPLAPTDGSSSGGDEPTVSIQDLLFAARPLLPREPERPVRRAPSDDWGL